MFLIGTLCNTNSDFNLQSGPVNCYKPGWLFSKFENLLLCAQFIPFAKGIPSYMSTKFMYLLLGRQETFNMYQSVYLVITFISLLYCLLNPNIFCNSKPCFNFWFFFYYLNFEKQCSMFSLFIDHLLSILTFSAQKNHISHDQTYNFYILQGF